MTDPFRQPSSPLAAGEGSNDESDEASGIAGGIRRGLGRGLEALFKPATEENKPEEFDADRDADQRSETLIATLENISAQASQYLEEIRKLEDAAMTLTKQSPRGEGIESVSDEKPLHVWTRVEGFASPSKLEGASPWHNQAIQGSRVSLAVFVSSLPGFASLAEIADRLPRSTPILECNLIAYEDGNAELELVLPEDTAREQGLRWVRDVVADLPDGGSVSVKLQSPVAD